MSKQYERSSADIRYLIVDALPRLPEIIFRQRLVCGLALPRQSHLVETFDSFTTVPVLPGPQGDCTTEIHNACYAFSPRDSIFGFHVPRNQFSQTVNNCCTGCGIRKSFRHVPESGDTVKPLWLCGYPAPCGIQLTSLEQADEQFHTPTVKRICSVRLSVCDTTGLKYDLMIFCCTAILK